jgi:predicted nucleic acid-binding protein
LKAQTQVMVGKKEIQMTLRFVDAMIYAPGYTLDQITQDYKEKKVVERVKDSYLQSYYYR